MAKSYHQLYNILSACAGNWRNCVYISADGPGYLLSASWDGQPVVMGINQFQRFTGVQIDPAECCGQITETAFNSLYAQYLLWHTVSAKEHPLMTLCKNHTDSI